MIYDYKADLTVQEKEFKDIETLVEDIVSAYEVLRRDEYLSVHAGLETIKKLHNELIFYIDDYRILRFDRDCDWRLLYSDEASELILTIGYDGCIGIETATYDDGTYKNDDPALLYWHNRLKQADLEKHLDHSILIFGISDPDD